MPESLLRSQFDALGVLSMSISILRIADPGRTVAVRRWLRYLNNRGARDRDCCPAAASSAQRVGRAARAVIDDQRQTCYARSLPGVPLVLPEPRHRTTTTSPRREASWFAGKAVAVAPTVAALP